MPEISTPTLIHPPEPQLAATMARAPTPTQPQSNTTDETLVPASGTPQPTRSLSSGSAGFTNETRQLLRRRLILTHTAVGFATAFMVVVNLFGVPVLPRDAGMGRWIVGFPLLVCGQSVAGLVFLLRRPDAPLSACRLVEVSHFGLLGLFAGLARYLVLSAPPVCSDDMRYSLVLYRFDAVITNYPTVFAIIFYGVLIPNTQRRSLLGAGILGSIPLLATLLAAIVNPDVRGALTAIVPVTVLPLVMAAVIAVFCASRAIKLQRQAYEALREARQLGAYTLKEKLGEGGMGEVWLAEHRLLKRPCAMKFIRAELAANPDTARRFEREVRAVTTLTHFNTIRIFDYGSSEDGSFYYVMEYLDGPTLDKLVKERGPLTPGRAVYMLRQLCGALAEAHSDGMVHRDLKPNNILIAALGGQRDVVKLLDFGLVQDHSATESDDRITRAGTVLGTPSYMCPEQAGGEAVDARGDLYSLGAVAFFMLAGRPPFEGSSVGKLISAHLTQLAPDIRTLRAETPADLAEVVAKCLAKDPRARFQSAAELDSALAACSCSMEWNASVAAQWWCENHDSASTKTEPDCNATLTHS